MAVSTFGVAGQVRQELEHIVYRYILESSNLGSIDDGTLMLCSSKLMSGLFFGPPGRSHRPVRKVSWISSFFDKFGQPVVAIVARYFARRKSFCQVAVEKCQRKLYSSEKSCLPDDTHT